MANFMRYHEHSPSHIPSCTVLLHLPYRSPRCGVRCPLHWLAHARSTAGPPTAAVPVRQSGDIKQQGACGRRVWTQGHVARQRDFRRAGLAAEGRTAAVGEAGTEVLRYACGVGARQLYNGLPCMGGNWW